MLPSAYFLATFRFDTAANEPAKKLQILQNFANFPHITPPAQVRNGAPVRFGTRGAAASRRGTSAMPKAAAASTTCSSWLTTMRSTELMNCVELMCSFRNYNLN